MLYNKSNIQNALCNPTLIFPPEIPQHPYMKDKYMPPRGLLATMNRLAV